MVSKLGKNIVLNVSYNILSIIVPLITAPYIGRVLGAENVGIYTYVFSIASYFVMFGLLGVSNYGTREIAKVRDNMYQRSKIFCEIYSMQIVSGSIAAIAYIVYLTLFADRYDICGWIMLFYVLTATFDITFFFSGIENFQSIVLRNIIVKIFNLMFIFIFVNKKEDLTNYIWVMSLCYLLNSLLLWPSMLRKIKIVRPKVRNIMGHFKSNVLLFIPTIAASVYQIMDKIMIGGLSETTQLAYYEYADKILNIPNVIFGAIGAVMLSRVSHELNNSENEVRTIISYSMDLSFIISVASVFGVEAVCDELVYVYYGEEFIRTANILYVLAPVIFLYGWNSVLRMQYIIPSNKEDLYIGATIAGAIVNLILNICLIPRFGAIGATIGTILAQLVITIIFWWYLKNELPLNEYVSNNFMVILNGVVMYLNIKFVASTHPPTIIGLFIDLGVGMLSFLLGLLIIGNICCKHFIGKILKKEGKI